MIPKNEDPLDESMAIVIKQITDKWSFDVSRDGRKNIYGEVQTDKWLNIKDELLIKGRDYIFKCKVYGFEDGWALIEGRPKDFICQ